MDDIVFTRASTTDIIRGFAKFALMILLSWGGKESILYLARPGANGAPRVRWVHTIVNDVQQALARGGTGSWRVD